MSQPSYKWRGHARTVRWEENLRSKKIARKNENSFRLHPSAMILEGGSNEIDLRHVKKKHHQSTEGRLPDTHADRRQRREITSRKKSAKKHSAKRSTTRSPLRLVANKSSHRRVQVCRKGGKGQAAHRGIAGGQGEPRTQSLRLSVKEGKEVATQNEHHKGVPGK